LLVKPIQIDRGKMRIYIPILTCLFLICTCQARTITVDDDGPADFNNIQAAINDANNGDTVIVADGTYTGTGNRDVDFLGKSITVRSENGPTNCIIDCNGSFEDEHYGFIMFCSDCSLEGFTIRGATTTNCDFGGGVTCRTNALIRNCIFQDNYSSCFGAAIGYAGLCGAPYSNVINCTFYNNSSPYSGSAVATWGGTGDKIILQNCISWGNTTPDLDIEVRTKCGLPKISANFSILQSSWYGSTVTVANIIVADPCFVDPFDGDFHLQSQAGRWNPNSQSWVTDANTSVAIDAGDPNSDWRGELWPHGKRINMGAYGGTAEASMSPSSIGNIANLNNDANDMVDYNDLALFADKWLYQKVLLAEDLNRDGSVDIVDYAIFAGNWLSQ
jgi:hypothetical protein